MNIFLVYSRCLIHFEWINEWMCMCTVPESELMTLEVIIHKAYFMFGDKFIPYCRGFWKIWSSQVWILALSLWQRLASNQFPFLPGHIARLHLPTSLRVGHNLVMGSDQRNMGRSYVFLRSGLKNLLYNTLFSVTCRVTRCRNPAEASEVLENVSQDWRRLSPWIVQWKTIYLTPSLNWYVNKP